MGLTEPGGPTPPLPHGADRAVHDGRAVHGHGLQVARNVDPAGAAFESEPSTKGKPDTMVAAINQTLKDEMARMPNILVFG